MRRKAKAYIGTSGWSYKHWHGKFYPQEVKPKDFMAYYAKVFKTVELNSSFYRLPPKETFEGWNEKSPEDFLFSVKASRFITHIKKLKDVKEALDNFVLNAEGLEEKLGVILFQLPPSWKFDEQRFADFLAILPGHLRCTFEFRNPTWYNDKALELLKKYHCAFCIYELNGHKSPEEVTADFVYIRLHGPGGKYQGSYTEKILASWADKISGWMEEKRDVFCYFDNDQEAYAAFNAQTLLEMTKEKIKI